MKRSCCVLYWSALHLIYDFTFLPTFAAINRLPFAAGCKECGLAGNFEAELSLFSFSDSHSGAWSREEIFNLSPVESILVFSLPLSVLKT